MRFTVRRGCPGDLAALLALEGNFPSDRLSQRGFRHLLTRAHADVWVAADGDELLGNAVLLYRRNARAARLYSLVVAPAARGRGIARALVQTLEAAAAAGAARGIYLEVRCDNDAAINLYRKLGYRCVRRLPNFYEDGQDGFRLERLLPLSSAAGGPGPLAA